MISLIDLFIVSLILKRIKKKLISNFKTGSFINIYRQLLKKYKNNESIEQILN